jgi:general transcription factor 3C polypeptide 3 (transcription factor C subunit 4)
LRFYEPLKKRPEALDSRFCFDLAICYQTLGREEDYKNSLQIFKRNARDPQYHIGLAKLYQSQGKEEDMWHLIKQLKRMGKSDLIRNAGLPLLRPVDESGISQSIDNATRGEATPPVRQLSEEQGAKRRYANHRRRLREKEQYDQQQDMIIGSLWTDLKALQQDVDAGDLDAEAEWLGIANEVFDDFRDQKLFFPRDRHTKFMGYQRWKRTVNLPEDDQLFATEVVRDEEIPVHYRNIHFDDWLDFILQLALRHAKYGNSESCWDVLNVAQNANIFAHDQPRIVLTRNVAMSMH